MNHSGASAALQAIAVGDHTKLDELCTWISAADGVVGRYLASDLRDAALTSASAIGDGGLDALLSELAGRPPSILVAFFPGARAPGLFELPGARIGPAAELLDAAPSRSAMELWPSDGDTLAVLTDHPAQGRLGAMRNASWLQTVLGAISLAAYARSKSISPLAFCPVLGTALFLSTSSGNPDLVDQSPLLAPGVPPTADLADLMSTRESYELLLDATARAPSDLAQRRLTLAARWLQLAASSINTSDGLVALGVALETITGDNEKGAVVERITKRAAVFLAGDANPAERGDIYYEELRRAKKLYDLRSRAAHGQFDEWTTDPHTSNENREELHRFVLDVALGFRRHARERNLRDGDDFVNWWKRVELEGIFA